jgi:F420-0:gamma-glutamyl ligase-like protein
MDNLNKTDKRVMAITAFNVTYIVLTWFFTKTMLTLAAIACALGVIGYVTGRAIDAKDRAANIRNNGKA